MTELRDLDKADILKLKILEAKHHEYSGNDYKLIYEEDLDDANVFVDIIEEDNNIVSALVVCEYDDYMELRGLTLPNRRNQGYFKKLLNRCDIFYDDVPVIYTLDNSMNTENHCHFYSDYLLEVIPFSRKKSPIPAGFSLSGFNNDTWNFYKDGILIGSISFSYGESRNCIYDVEIIEKYRGQGYSKLLLELALSILPQEKPVILHVTSDNEPACKAYFNAGFYILESIDYYIL